MSLSIGISPPNPKRVSGPQPLITLSCQAARVPEPVWKTLRQVYPSPFTSMDGSGSARPAPASTTSTGTSPGSKLAGHPPIGGPGSGAGAATAALAAITAISAATANTKSIRLIKHYLLVYATLGGLLPIVRRQLEVVAVYRLSHRPAHLLPSFLLFCYGSTTTHTTMARPGKGHIVGTTYLWIGTRSWRLRIST